MAERTDFFDITQDFIKTFMLGGILLIAIALTYVSYQFELKAYTLLLGNTFGDMSDEVRGTSLLVLFAASLNCAKIALTWVIKQTHGVSRVSSKGLRALIITNSVLMTLLVFSASLVDPNAGQALQQTKAQAAQVYNEGRGAIISDHDRRIRELSIRVQRDVDAESTKHSILLGELTKELTKERGIGGQGFKGARYRELEALIEKEHARHNAVMSRIQNSEAVSSSKLNSMREEALKTFDVERNRGQSKANITDFTGSLEAQNPAVVRFVSAMSAFGNHDKFTPQLAAILLTMLMTLIVEFLPIILIGHILDGGKPQAKRSANIIPLPFPNKGKSAHLEEAS